MGSLGQRIRQSPAHRGRVAHRAPELPVLGRHLRPQLHEPHGRGPAPGRMAEFLPQLQERALAHRPQPELPPLQQQLRPRLGHLQRARGRRQPAASQRPLQSQCLAHQPARHPRQPHPAAGFRPRSHLGRHLPHRSHHQDPAHQREPPPRRRHQPHRPRGKALRPAIRFLCCNIVAALHHFHHLTHFPHLTRVFLLLPPPPRQPPHPRRQGLLQPRLQHPPR